MAGWRCQAETCHTVTLLTVMLESTVMVLPTGIVTLELPSESLPPHVAALLHAPSAPVIGVAGCATLPQATARVSMPGRNASDVFIHQR